MQLHLGEIVKSLWTAFSPLLGLLKIPILAILSLVLLFVFLIALNVFIKFVKGERIPKGTSRQHVKKRTILQKLFIDLPKRIVDDFFERDPDFFPYQGLIIFEGRQGNGKTISAIQLAREMQREYLKAKCITNLYYKYEDDELKHWSQLIDYKNRHIWCYSST